MLNGNESCSLIKLEHERKQNCDPTAHERVLYLLSTERDRSASCHMRS